MKNLPRITLISSLLLAGSCEQNNGPTPPSQETKKQRVEITMEREGMITIKHPSQVPPVSIVCGEDGFVVNQNFAEPGTLLSLTGNIYRIWMNGQENGRIFVRRNCSHEAVREAGRDVEVDRSIYEDFNGDGVVDYKRNHKGLFRVSEIVWEKIGNDSDVPPEAPSRRVDTHKLTPKAQQAGAGQPATRPVDEPEGSDKPQPEAERRSR